MGANVWFWLLWVITLLFGVWGMNPWRPSGQPWAPFGGWLVLSGLLESDRAPVAAAFAVHGLAVVDSGALHDAAGDDWISLLLRHAGR